MILRLLRVRVVPGAAPELITRLREQVVPEALSEPGLVGLNYGFRRRAADTCGLAISAWESFDALLAATGGNTQRVGTSVALGDIVDEVDVTHYEIVESASTAEVILDGGVIGIIASRLKPHVESSAFEMIRASAEAVYEAGAIARYIGRRVDGAYSEVVATVVWPDRAALRRYARGRPDGFMRPAYMNLLESWTFETYDSLSPSRLQLSSAGPAVLLADDDGRYVDASPGVERVFGLPGEFMLGRQVWDFTPPTALDTGRQMWREFVSAGALEGEYDMLRPNGGTVTVRFRAQANCPETGLHASVLALPDDERDERPLADIVAEAFAGQESLD